MPPKLVRGTPVISLADGAAVGVVDRVYLDRERLAVVGFTIRQRGGLLGGGPIGLIDLADVHAFRPDVVTIDSGGAARSDLTRAAAPAPLVALDALPGRSVVTHGGHSLGRIAEVVFDESSRQLLALELEATDGDLRRVATSAVTTVGEDLVVVAEPVARVVTLPSARPDRVSANDQGVSRGG